MTWFRNLSASEVDRVQRRVNRAEAKSPLRNGTMLEGVLTIAGEARLEFEGDGNLPDIPDATPTRGGLMTADYAGQLEALPTVAVSSAAGRRVSVGESVVFYDSGWRNVAALLGPSVDLSASWVQIRRTLHSIQIRGSVTFTGGTGPATLLTIPSAIGWRPSIPGNSDANGVVVNAAIADAECRLRINPSGVLQYLKTVAADGSTSTGRPTGDDAITLAATFIAPPELPQTLIGSST